MSLAYKMNKIGERGLPWGTPWMGMTGSLSWSLIKIISFLCWRKLTIPLINFLSRPIDINLERRPSNQTWSKAFSTSRNIPAVGWCCCLSYWFKTAHRHHDVCYDIFHCHCHFFHTRFSLSFFLRSICSLGLLPRRFCITCWYLGIILYLFEASYCSFVVGYCLSKRHDDGELS